MADSLNIPRDLDTKADAARSLKQPGARTGGESPKVPTLDEAYRARQDVERLEQLFDDREDVSIKLTVSRKLMVLFRERYPRDLRAERFARYFEEGFVAALNRERAARGEPLLLSPSAAMAEMVDASAVVEAFDSKRSVSEVLQEWQKSLVGAKDGTPEGIQVTDAGMLAKKPER